MIKNKHRAKAPVFTVLSQLFIPILKPLVLLIGLFIFGSLGYFIIGWYYDQNWNLLDCAYMTSITLTTVGYGDMLGASNFNAGQIFTMILAVAGLGGTLYSISIITAFVVEGRFRKVLLGIKMREKIASLRHHTIICGAGETGRYVAAEHIAKNRPFVVIERDKNIINNLKKEYTNLTYILGDATDEEILVQAGISNSQHIIACLDTDRDNLFLVVCSRWLSKNIDIVVKCESPKSTGKFIQAGANHVVNPGLIGGLRMAGLVLMPQYTHMMDSLFQTGRDGHFIQEFKLNNLSKLCDKTLQESKLQHDFGALILGLRSQEDQPVLYLPHPNTKLKAGMIILVLGQKSVLPAVEEKLAGNIKEPS